MRRTDMHSSKLSPPDEALLPLGAAHSLARDGRSA